MNTHRHDAAVNANSAFRTWGELSASLDQGYAPSLDPRKQASLIQVMVEEKRSYFDVRAGKTVNFTR